jgi:molecular chaperone Hsp33
MKDHLVRILTDKGNVRALACATTGLALEGARRHGTLPTASAALGRALTAGGLLGALLKTGQRVALKFEGNGPLRKIVVEAESTGAVHGYVAVPEVNMIRPDGKLDVAGALGKAGLLTVTKDLRMREPYTSTVQLVSSEIAEDVAYYLTESEQIPSAVGLGVFVDAEGIPASAGGFLVQALPQADPELLDLLMERIAALPPLSRLFLDGATPEDLLARLFEGIPYRTLEKRELAFVCSCSREKIDRVLISLGGEELADIIEREDSVAVTCEFCREVYTYSKEQVEELRRHALS